MSAFKKTVLLLLVLFIVSVSGLYAFGTKEVPEIPPITSGAQYMSPNGDGVQDEATLDFKVKIYVQSEKGYVPEYGMRIIDPAGNVVAEKIETEESDVFWLFQIFMGYDEFNLEKEITWDGKDPDGNIVSDGVYSVVVWVKDSSNNVTEVDVDDFIIDTKAPEVAVRKPESLMFSPNNDGVGDVLIILQEDGTVEKEWNAVITDSKGKKVKTFSWKNQAPEDMLWDGTDDSGVQLPNGKYDYLISSTDEAGNKSKEYRVKGLRIDAAAPGFKISAASDSFSPNADGVMDRLEIVPAYEQEELITKWSWSLADKTGVVRQQQGTSDEGLPEKIVLDGLNSTGLPLFPGRYLFSMSVTYPNSWRPVAEKEVEIDIAAPRVEILPERLAFSPNGDGLGDTVSVRYKANEPVTWEGSIIDMTGEVVLETDSARTTSRIVWDGRAPDGTEIPDGEYLVLGVFTDLAGNVTFAEPFTFKIDRRPVRTVLKVPGGFSPNGDGYEDELKIGIDSELYVDINEWKMVIIDDTGEALTTIRGRDTMPKSVSWDGMVAQEGNFAPALEGSYQAVLYVDYVKGDFVKAQSDLFVLDNKPPKIEMVVKTNPFAETDHGLEGSVLISVNVEDNEDVSGWMLDVYDKNGNVVRTYAGSGNPSGDITWSTAQNGIQLESGERYTINLRVTDMAGNTATLRKTLPIDVMLVKKDGKYFVMVPNIIFGAYKYSLDSAGPAREKDNMNSLRKIVELSKRFPQYGLILDAHALNIYRGGSREEVEEKILLPLTEKRAAEVKRAPCGNGNGP